MLKSSVLDKIELTTKNLNSIEMIESLRRLQYMRRFSKDETTELKLQLSRDIYIETSVNLARRAGYNARRIMRVAHEVNRSFEVSLEPQHVHQYVEKLLEEEYEDITYSKIVELFEITDEELIVILGTNSEKINTILIPGKSY